MSVGVIDLSVGVIDLSVGVIDLQVVEPHALVESQGRLRLNGMYYIQKQIIPALERVLSLVGVALHPSIVSSTMSRGRFFLLRSDI